MEKKNRFILITILLFVTIVFGKEKNNFTKLRFSNASNKNSCKILNDLTNEYLKKGKLKQAKVFNIKALACAEKYKKNEQKVFAFLNLASIYIKQKKIMFAEKALQDALIIAKSIKNKQIEIYVYDKQFSFFYSIKKDMILTIQVCKSLENLYKETQDLKNQALFTHIQGSLYSGIGEKIKSIEYTNKALLLYKKVGDKKSVIQMLTYLGNRNQQIGNFSKALYYLKKAEEDVAKLKKVSFIHLRVITDFFIFYKRLEKYDRALYYLDKGITFAKKMGESFKFDVQELYSKKAEILIEQGNYSLANICLKKSVLFRRTDKNWTKKDFFKEYKLSKSRIELKKKNYLKSIKMFSEVITSTKIEQNSKEYARIYMNFGEAYIGLSELKKAKKYLKIALNIYKKHKNIFPIKKAYLLMSKLYKKKGNKSKYEHYFKLSEQINIEF